MIFGSGRRPGQTHGAPDAAVALLAMAFVTLCSLPHAARLFHPSLFSDDVIRIADLQTKPLLALLLRPFNEHVAPVFELVSWTTWQLAGRLLSNAAVAFTMASILPFLLCMPALGELVRRESRSLTTGLCATAVFCLSAVHSEAVWWYSASSFAWALLGALVTWLCVLRALPEGSAPDRATGWWIGTVLAAATAPACSAIGLLAGPLGALRAAPVPGLQGRRRLVVLIPLAGTVLYLVIAGGSRYGLMLCSSVQKSSNSVQGLLCCLRAPADVLVPGLIGLGNADRWLGGGQDLVLSALMLVGCLIWARRRPGRPLVLGGLAAVLGGYGMTYGVRNVFGTHWLMEVQRYHLFPQFGFVLIMASLARPWLERFDARPRSSLLFATAFALVLLLINRPLLSARVRAYKFPDQPRTLRALDRLDQVCRDHGIMRDQALLALGPVRPRWFPHDSNALAMLADSVKTPSLSANQALSALMTALSVFEREALCGGMDASAFLQPSGQARGADTTGGCRLVGGSGFSPLGPGRWLAVRSPAYLEFELDDPANRSGFGPARWLCVPGSESAERVEVWWTGRKGFWSEARSVHWGPVPEGASTERGVPLGRLPHWSQAQFTQIRVLVRSDHPVTLETPRVLR
jgi:hypothetical protein